MDKLNKITAFVGPASLIALGTLMIVTRIEMQKSDKRIADLKELIDLGRQEVKTAGSRTADFMRDLNPNLVED